MSDQREQHEPAHGQPARPAPREPSQPARPAPREPSQPAAEQPAAEHAGAISGEHPASGEHAGELLERERFAVEALRAARLRDRAPQSLRLRLAAQVAQAGPRAGRRLTGALRPRASWGAAAGARLPRSAAVGAVAVAVAILLIAVPKAAPGGPSLAQAAALASRGPTAPAPGIDPRAPGRSLAIALGRLRFPNWAWAFSLRAVGARSDVLGGRRAVTVYYAGGRQRVAYTILSDPAVLLSSGRRTRLGGLALLTASVHGRAIVSWHEDGETCLLQGSGVTTALLRELAAWMAPSG